MAGRSFPFAARLAAPALLAAVLVTGCSGIIPTLRLPPPAHITVRHKAVVVPPGTTFGEVVADRHLEAPTGRLLSVAGAVLDAQADPGRILLDGATGPPSQRLVSGDRIVVVPGTDRVEPVTRTTVRLPGLHPGDPENTLATYPITRVRVTGKISGDTVSVKDVTSGRGVTPPRVALTFDDGPWPGATRQVIAVLKHFHVPATFFEIGDLVQRWPSIARSVQQAGFEVGDHSWDHPLFPPLAKRSTRKIASEISRAADALDAVGAAPSLFRPPGGSYDDLVVQQARVLGMRVVLWSVDPQDWRSGLTPKHVAHAVLSHVEAGSIVLLHDGGGDAAHTIAALPAIIKGIRRMGLGFATVPAGP
jgi:peptidoglycan/xylan/chitin deacetylase (PgdA/CDA1 family)